MRAQSFARVPDPCPLCRTVLGLPTQSTRRLVVVTAEPGTFVWRCPDCRGIWQEKPGEIPKQVRRK